MSSSGTKHLISTIYTTLHYTTHYIYCTTVKTTAYIHYKFYTTYLLKNTFFTTETYLGAGLRGALHGDLGVDRGPYQLVGDVHHGLELHDERDALADRGRDLVAGDAEVGAHLLAADVLQLQVLALLHAGPRQRRVAVDGAAVLPPPRDARLRHLGHVSRVTRHVTRCRTGLTPAALQMRLALCFSLMLTVLGLLSSSRMVGGTAAVSRSVGAGRRR